MPIGVWSTSSTRSICSPAVDRRSSRAARRRSCVALRGDQRAAGWRSSTSRASVRLAASPTRRSRRSSRPSGMRDVDVLQVVQASRPSTSMRGVPLVDRAARLQRMPQRLREEAAGDRVRDAHRARRPCPARRPGRRSLPAPGPRSITWSARRIVSSSCSTTTSVLPLRLELARACRAGCGCRADAGRWSARRGCSTRRAGSSRAARRAGCAAPRRPRASAPSGRARGSRARPRSRKPSRDASSARMSRAISASRPVQLERRRRSARSRSIGSARQLGDRSGRASARRAPRGSAAGRRTPGRRSSTSSHSIHESSTWSSAPVCSRSSTSRPRRSSGRCRSSAAHQPCFELNENSRGSSSGKLRPHERAGALGRERPATSRLASQPPSATTCTHALADLERAARARSRSSLLVRAASPRRRRPAARWCAP